MTALKAIAVIGPYTGCSHKTAANLIATHISLNLSV